MTPKSSVKSENTVNAAAYRLPTHKLMTIGFCMLLALAAGVRAALGPVISPDFRGSIQGWYDYLIQNGFGGLATIHSDYNMPYLYLLYLASLFHLDALVADKLISCAFDVLLAYGVMLVVREYRPRHYLPQLAGIGALFLPTVFLNSSMWGQCDSIFTAFLLLSFVALQRRKYWSGWAWWGAALVFKLQAMLFLPLPFFLWLVDRRGSIFAPVVVVPIFLGVLVPGWIAGRPALDLLGIYFNQAAEYGNVLSYNAPTFYQWISPWYAASFTWAGVCLAAAAVLFALLGALIAKRGLEKDEMLVFATFLLFLVTFLLPKMHERYFFPAEVFALALAFIRPQMIVIVVLSQIVSLFAYSPYLMNEKPPVALNLLPFGMCIILLLLGREMFGTRKIGDVSASN